MKGTDNIILTGNKAVNTYFGGFKPFYRFTAAILPNSEP
jgi:hypothetical protein